MCVSYCHQTSRIYDNHEDCQPQWCKYAQMEYSSCETCSHCQDKLCGLTRNPLPNPSGCCHWNVELMSRSQQITLADLQMLGVGANEMVRDILNGFDLPYEIDDQDRIWLDPDALALPVIYGQGSDH